MGLIIRKAEKKDNLILANIIRKTFEEHDAPRTGTVYSDPTTDDLYGFFLRPASVLWVAVVDEKVIGCCGVYPSGGLEKECAELVKFYLTKEARGKGFGKILLHQCIESAKEMGYTQLYLESLPQFSNAVKLYEKEGFRRLDHPLGDFIHSSCSIWMLKDLTME
jgi:putative acetyltransferase